MGWRPRCACRTPTLDPACTIRRERPRCAITRPGLHRPNGSRVHLFRRETDTSPEAQDFPRLSCVLSAGSARDVDGVDRAVGLRAVGIVRAAEPGHAVELRPVTGDGDVVV